MSNSTDPRHPGMPWLTPYLTVADAERAVAFYEQAFGFRLKDAARGDDGAIMHVEMTYRDRVIVMFAPENAFNEMKAPATTGHAVSLNFYVYCDDVDAMIGRASEAGAEVVLEPDDQFWGDRFGMVRDPDGYLWGFARSLEGVKGA